MHHIYIYHQIGNIIMRDIALYLCMYIDLYLHIMRLKRKHRSEFCSLEMMVAVDG